MWINDSISIRGKFLVSALAADCPSVWLLWTNYSSHCNCNVKIERQMFAFKFPNRAISLEGASGQCAVQSRLLQAF